MDWLTSISSTFSPTELGVFVAIIAVVVFVAIRNKTTHAAIATDAANKAVAAVTGVGTVTATVIEAPPVGTLGGGALAPAPLKSAGWFKRFEARMAAPAETAPSNPDVKALALAISDACLAFAKSYVPPVPVVAAPDVPKVVVWSPKPLYRNEALMLIDLTANGFKNAIYVDSVEVLSGFGPPLNYWTQNDGTVSIVKPANAPSGISIAPTA
jgi:hypothetical protein